MQKQTIRKGKVMKKSFYIRSFAVSLALLSAVSLVGCSQAKNTATAETATMSTAESGLSNSIDFVSSLDADSITKDFVNEHMDELRVVSRNMNPILASKVITILNEDGGEKVDGSNGSVARYWVYAKHGNSALVQVPMPVFGDEGAMRYSNSTITSSTSNIGFEALCDTRGCVMDSVEVCVDNLTTDNTRTFVAENGYVGYVESDTDDGGVTGSIFYQIPAVSNDNLTFDGPCTIRINYTVSASATDAEKATVTEYFKTLGITTE